MSEKNHIADLFSEVRDLSAQADELGLREVRAILDYACDRLVLAYHQSIPSAQAEADTLCWNRDAWPSATAVLLEMKSMIRAMEAAESTQMSGAAGQD
ncbi:hypothetical protein [Parvularcula sp. IMCC14364]|uniref:hypothetical protein n=1 Tax=Parvularcula sp. IMCC14364 TaxID=3067902 RepID=UPI002741DB71|nr:hypothetical protein [Parvularcula sp. IMCC14364]